MATAGQSLSRRAEPLVLTERPHPTVVQLTLNRPEKLNALSVPLLRELSEALALAQKDSSVGCVIITGSGKAFSAGADILGMIDRGVEAYADPERLQYWKDVEAFPKPLIGAINGYALGGGLELAMLCDILLASSNAKFSTPEIKLGSFPGDGGTQRLPRLVGKSFAMQMVLTGMMIDAELAERKGIVSEVVAAGQLLQRAQELAVTIASMSVAITPVAKSAINAAFEFPLREGVALEHELTVRAFATEDRIEGLVAFKERRSPVFRGR